MSSLANIFLANYRSDDRLKCFAGLYGLVAYSTISQPIVQNGQIVAAFCLTTGHPEVGDFARRYLPVMEFVVGQGAPFCIMFSCNTAIIIRLVISARRRQQTSNCDNQKSVSSATTMLLLSTTMFLVLTLPHALRFLGGFETKTPSAYLFSLAAQIMRSCHFATNFFVYCISGTRFREELIRMFACKAKSGSEPGTSMSNVDGSTAF